MLHHENLQDHIKIGTKSAQPKASTIHNMENLILYHGTAMIRKHEMNWNDMALQVWFPCKPLEDRGA